MREPGFYWVRLKDNSDWSIAEWLTSNVFKLIADRGWYAPGHLHEIDERRIEGARKWVK